MKRFNKYLTALAAVSLFSLPATIFSQQTESGKFTTINFPGAVDTVECCSATLNINEEGQIVGGYMDASGTGHGFLLKAGKFSTIDFPGAVYTEALGINPGGHIVGEYLDANMKSHGFLLTPRGFSTIDGPSATNTFINWINPQGEMVGGYSDAGGVFHGLLVSRGDLTTIDFPSASNTFGLGINAQGEIVGQYIDSAGLNAHGFQLSKGKFSTFDFPGSLTDLSACNNFGGGATYTNGINDEGAIVGGYCGADNHVHGFLLTREEGDEEELSEQPEVEVMRLKGTFSTIDFPHAIFNFTSGINSEGKIVGGYQSVDGHYHGFLLNDLQQRAENLGQFDTGNENAASAASNQTRESPKVAIPENARRLIRQRLALGRWGRLIKPR
jgi:uncharacterized membrane protein